MHNGRHAHHHSVAPVTLGGAAATQLPWWTMLTSTMGGWVKGTGHAVNRAALAEAERSASMMNAGRRMGRRYWQGGGNWGYPDRRKGRK